MKKSFRLLTSILVVFLSISCSGDDNQTNDSEILGVWELTEVTVSAVTTFRLVFGEVNTGLRIYAVVNNSGDETSSLETFTWEFNGSVVSVLGNDDSEHDYEINDDGHLVVDEEGEGEDIVLEKVTSDYSAYY